MTMISTFRRSLVPPPSQEMQPQDVGFDVVRVAEEALRGLELLSCRRGLQQRCARRAVVMDVVDESMPFCLTLTQTRTLTQTGLRP